MAGPAATLPKDGISTESTPLSSSTTEQNRSYNTTQSPASHHNDADQTSSAESDDSAGGYVSGSGRRESVVTSTAKRKSYLSPSNASTSQRSPSPRNTSGEPHAYQRGSALTWAFDNAAGSEAGRAASPASGTMMSPRMKPSLTDGAGPTIDGSSSPRSAAGGDAAIRRRSSKLQKGSSASASRATSKSSKRGSRQDDPGADGDELQEDSWAWFRDLADKYGAIELDNKGSVARDHLALERTFLAWLRTSLAFASIGIAITQLFRLNSTLRPDEPHSPPADSPLLRLRNVGKPLGTTFLGVAILILIMGWRRYFESQYWIIRGKFPASRGSVFLITFLTMALIVISLVVVISVGKVV